MGTEGLPKKQFFCIMKRPPVRAASGRTQKEAPTLAQNPNDNYRAPSSRSTRNGQDSRPRKHTENDWLYEDWQPRSSAPAQPPRKESRVQEDYEYDYIFTPKAQPSDPQRRRAEGKSGGKHSADGRRTAAYQEGRRAGSQHGRGGPPPKKKKKRRSSVLKGLYIAIVVLAVLIVAGYGATKFLLTPPSTDDPAASQETLEPGAVPGLSGGKYPHREQTYTFLLVCPDQESGNADAIMIVTYDVPNQKIGMLSIPRDTLVNEKNPKINSSYHAGIENLSRVVSELTGLDFNFTVEIKLEAIAELVDQVGGIDFDVPVEMYYDDPAQDLSIHYMPGMQHLNGQQAVEVCRFRHNADGTGYKLGDVERSQTVRNVMATTAKKLVSFSNVGKIKEFINIFQRNVETNLSASDILWFASQAIQLDLNTAITSTALEGDGSVTYNGTKWCYQLYADKALEAINQYVNPYAQTLTAADLKIFRPVP